MSTAQELRAMREAKYARARAAAGAPPLTRTPPAAAPSAAAPAPVAPVAPGPDDTDGGAEVALCGHRNMGGRTCTREQGHAAKNHRYS